VGTHAWHIEEREYERHEQRRGRRHAVETLGFRVVMVADATAAARDEDHNATLHTIYRSFGDVRPTIEVLDLIER
jgi:nicotinamidase-related amidase